MRRRPGRRLLCILYGRGRCGRCAGPALRACRSPFFPPGRASRAWSFVQGAVGDAGLPAFWRCSRTGPAPGLAEVERSEGEGRDASAGPVAAPARSVRGTSREGLGRVARRALSCRRRMVLPSWARPAQACEERAVRAGRASRRELVLSRQAAPAACEESSRGGRRLRLRRPARDASGSRSCCVGVGAGAGALQACRLGLLVVLATCRLCIVKAVMTRGVSGGFAP